MKVSKTLYDKIVYLAIFSLYIVLLFLTIRNLFADTLWFDESGQFFISKGLNHFSEPLAREGGIADVIYNNARYNHDPGAFSIILHYWSMASSNYIWLRILPFLMFLLTIVFTCLNIHKLTGCGKFSLMGGLIVFLICQNNSSYLIRGYSMELLCIAFGVWSYLRIKENCSNNRLLVASLILSLLLGARYSSIVFTFVISLFVCLCIIKQQATKKEKVIKAAIYSIPLFLSVLFYYLFALSVQNPDMVKLPHTVTLLTNPSILFGVSGLLLLLTLIIYIYNFNKNDSVKIFGALTISTELLFVMLSIKGSVPYDLVNSKHCGGLFWYYLVFFYCIIVIKIKDAKYSHLTMIVLLAGLLSTSLISCNSLLLRNYSNDSFYQTSADIDKLNMQEYPEIYVTYFMCPTVKYYYEYYKGKEVADKDNYPSKFKFVESYEHRVVDGRDPLWRYQQTEANHKKDIELLPSGSLIIGPYEMLIPMEHLSFEGLSKVDDTWEFYVKE